MCRQFLASRERLSGDADVLRRLVVVDPECDVDPVQERGQKIDLGVEAEKGPQRSHAPRRTR
jgi:hypothetical protein